MAPGDTVVPGNSPVVCFLDESATDAKDLDQAVLAGTVMNRRDIPEFARRWAAVLAKHRFNGALHMKELGAKGGNPHLVGDAGYAFMKDVVGVINGCRIFTFGASWDNRKHEQLFSATIRRRFLSVYGLTFMMAIEINRAHAIREGFGGDIDHILDDGNQFKSQIEQFRMAIKTEAVLAGVKLGGVWFRSDAVLPALQAADVLAWATRRRKAGKELAGMYEPLEHLFDDSYADSPAPDRVVRKLARRVRLAERGINPDLFLGFPVARIDDALIGAAGVGLVISLGGILLSQYLWIAGGTIVAVAAILGRIAAKARIH